MANTTLVDAKILSDILDRYVEGKIKQLEERRERSSKVGWTTNQNSSSICLGCVEQRHENRLFKY